MKHLKTLSVIILCLVLTATAFVGCSKKEENTKPITTQANISSKEINGKWYTTADLTADMDETFKDSVDEKLLPFFKENKKTVSARLVYEFNKNESYTISIEDESAFKKQLRDYMTEYVDIITNAHYAYAKSQKISKADYDKQYEQENGAPLKDSLAKAYDVENFIGIVTERLKVTEPQAIAIEDDLIIHKDENNLPVSYIRFEFKDGKLILLSSLDENGNLDINNYKYPITLTR